MLNLDRVRPRTSGQHTPLSHYFAVQVDLLLHGHHHTYQRTCPVYQGQCMGLDLDGSPLAPIYVVIGNAGAGLSTNFLTPDPEWLQVGAMSPGFLFKLGNQLLYRTTSCLLKMESTLGQNLALMFLSRKRNVMEHRETPWDSKVGIVSLSA